jgi:hypothetical protein
MKKLEIILMFPLLLLLCNFTRSGAYRTPIQLKRSINLLLNHTQDNTVFSSSNFFRYDNFGNGYAYQ